MRNSHHFILLHHQSKERIKSGAMRHCWLLYCLQIFSWLFARTHTYTYIQCSCRITLRVFYREFFPSFVQFHYWSNVCNYLNVRQYLCSFNNFSFLREVELDFQFPRMIPHFQLPTLNWADIYLFVDIFVILLSFTLFFFELIILLMERCIDMVEQVHNVRMKFDKNFNWMQLKVLNWATQNQMANR